ncbi:MAG: Putrescine importer PuuP, partial [Pseudomonas sp.]|nr:Putrescine importer PuuP [Pseudomonas sp.]
MNTITNVADTPAHQTSTQLTSSLRFRQPLGLVGLVLFGLAYMVPLAVF